VTDFLHCSPVLCEKVVCSWCL